MPLWVVLPVPGANGWPTSLSASPSGIRGLRQAAGARLARPRAYSGHKAPAGGPPLQAPSDSPGRFTHSSRRRGARRCRWSATAPRARSGGLHHSPRGRGAEPVAAGVDHEAGAAGARRDRPAERGDARRGGEAGDVDGEAARAGRRRRRAGASRSCRARHPARGCRRRCRRGLRQRGQARDGVADQGAALRPQGRAAGSPCPPGRRAPGSRSRGRSRCPAPSGRSTPGRRGRRRRRPRSAARSRGGGCCRPPGSASRRSGAPPAPARRPWRGRRAATRPATAPGAGPRCARGARRRRARDPCQLALAGADGAVGLDVERPRPPPGSAAGARAAGDASPTGGASRCGRPACAPAAPRSRRTARVATPIATAIRAAREGRVMGTGSIGHGLGRMARAAPIGSPRAD